MKFIKRASIIFLLSLLIVSVMPLASVKHAKALSGSDFQPGRIIDDGVFFNPGGLTTNEIQSFLNAKVPVCDTNGTQPYGNTTRAAYGTSNGYPPPYTCLKDYQQTTVAKPYEPGICNGYGVETYSAARIIYGVAQSCGINPRVLVVLLEKEESLVTDDWPWPIQYRSATGYGCPDTAPCDSDYYGFFNQVYSAARQYKRYAKYSDQFNYQAQKNNYILYNPNSACGGSTVFIQNQATAGLYNYTPYQPNQAALNNLNGTGDGCSAYGNRNFWVLYNNWFGSTQTPELYWQPVQQQAFRDSSATVAADTNNLRPGERYYMVIKARNTGNLTWQKGVYGRQVNIGTDRAMDRRSAFCDSTWLGANCNRPATMTEQSVAPGEVGTFGFWITTPKQLGSFDEYFSLVMDGTGWFNDRGLYWTFVNRPYQLSWQPVSQAAYTDSGMTVGQDTTNLLPNQRYYLVVKAKNTSEMAWQTNVTNRQVNLGTNNQRDHTSPFCDSTWLGPNCNRPSTTLEQSVAPGEVGTFGFWINTPSSPGNYNEYYNLVLDGISWMQNDPGLYWTLNVKPIQAVWQPVSQAAYTDSNMTTPVNTTSLQKGQRYYLVLKAKNNGNATWQKGIFGRQVNVGTDRQHDRSSPFCDSTWLGPNCNRPSTTLEQSVAPGQTGTFGFWITAPGQTGTYNEYYNLVMDGLTWFNDPGLYWTLITN